MAKQLFLSLFVIYFAGLVRLYGQHHEEKINKASAGSEHHESHKKHLISASVNHTVIFSGVKNGSNKNITLPSFGLNYTYCFNHKWAVGLHNDIILEDFVVKGGNSEIARSVTDENTTTVIERGTPISAAVVAIYKPVPYLGLIAGVGREFSSHEDFTVIRFGIESPVHLPHNWELFGVLTYDINISAYESMNYGIGIGKLF